MIDKGYIDTGIVGSYLYPESFSDEVEALLQSIAICCISHLTEVEFYSLSARKMRTGQFTEAQVRHAMMKFDSLLEQGYFQRVAVVPDDYKRSKYYLSGLNTTLRTLDSLHIAIAERLGATLITSDRIQAEGADHFGIAVRRVGIQSA